MPAMGRQPIALLLDNSALWNGFPALQAMDHSRLQPLDWPQRFCHRSAMRCARILCNVLELDSTKNSAGGFAVPRYLPQHFL